MSRKDEIRPQAGGNEAEERHAVPSPARGNTVSAQGQATRQQPKAQTPNEVDESSHSQAADNADARRIGEIAHGDVMEGQQDTSKAQETDAAYHAMRQGADPAPVDKTSRPRKGG